MFSLQEKDTSKPAGNWFQLLMFLFTKKNWNIHFFPFATPTMVIAHIDPCYTTSVAATGPHDTSHHVLCQHAGFTRGCCRPSACDHVCTCDTTQLMCLYRLEACVGPCHIMTRFVQALGSPPRTKSTAGWDVTRCSVIDIYRLFLSPCFLRSFSRRQR